MKIPASSSLILATIAISSSSSSLAAPTGEVPPHADSSMTSSPSGHNIEGAASRSLRPADMQESIARATEEPRGLLGDLLGAILCPVLEIGCPPKSQGGKQAIFEAAANSHPTKDEAIADLQAAIDIIQNQLSGPPPPANDEEPDSSSSDADSSSPDASGSTNDNQDYNPPSDDSSTSSPSQDTSPSTVESPSSDASGTTSSESTESTPPTSRRRRRDVPNMGSGMVGTVAGEVPVQPGQVASNIPVQPGQVTNAAPIQPGQVINSLPIQPATAANSLPLQPAQIVNAVPLPVAGTVGTATGLVDGTLQPVKAIVGSVGDTLKTSVGAARRALPMPMPMRRWASRPLSARSHVPPPPANPPAAPSPDGPSPPFMIPPVSADELPSKAPQKAKSAPGMAAHAPSDAGNVIEEVPSTAFSGPGIVVSYAPAPIAGVAGEGLKKASPATSSGSGFANTGADTVAGGVENVGSTIGSKMTKLGRDIA
ncbi:hypothetical protein MIND_00516800 [Mycena indigotica]|uniref:Uncharacterized protein n=1 Tax=Mycena indigotica TaxID=2126181 RepID=A0A8H6W8R8_9AGAR|nr:uncharacterized protein MIND_00516800 [Mycena indigotica]KAF7307231.1 hypothetical protein MIND_00516800 [Mycena indigotica]